MMGAILPRFDQPPRKAEEIGPLRRGGRSTAGKIFFLLLFLIFAASLFAALAHGKQAATVKIVGIIFVQGSAGNRSVVPGAKVKLDGPTAFETETDEKGNYVFAAVPPGTYTVEAVSPGLEIRQTLRVEGGEVDVPLELKPLEVSTSVVVKADPTETQNPAPTETISDETLRDAPNVNERFESSLPLIPGVVRGPDGHVNLKGARSTQTGALFNSANATDPVTGSPALNLPIDVLASVQVIANPTDPQYGKFTGAVSTVATKTSDYDKFHVSIQKFIPQLQDRDGTITGIVGATPRMTFTGPIVNGRFAVTQSFQYRHVPTPVNSLPPQARDTKLESYDSYTQFDLVLSSSVDDRCEANRVEAGPAYQESVDLRLRPNPLRIFRFAAAAVYDANISCRLCSESTLPHSTDEAMSTAAVICRGALPTSHRLYRVS